MSLVLGVDVSTWQGRMDFAKCAAAGAKYAIIRAGSINKDTGALYTDFQFPRSREAVKDAPLKYGFYWYFRPNHSPVAQADYFTDLIETLPYTKQYVADFEDSGGGMPPATVADRQLAFLDRLERNGVPLGPGEIYTRASFWNIAVAARPGWARHGLHVARYVLVDPVTSLPNLAGPWADGKFKVRDWDEWLRWQYWADGNMQGERFGAESNSIDVNLEQVADVPEPPSSDDPLEPRVVALEAANIEQGAHLLAIEARLAAVKEAL